MRQRFEQKSQRWKGKAIVPGRLSTSSDPQCPHSLLTNPWPQLSPSSQAKLPYSSPSFRLQSFVAPLQISPFVTAVIQSPGQQQTSPFLPSAENIILFLCFRNTFLISHSHPPQLTHQISLCRNADRSPNAHQTPRLNLRGRPLCNLLN